jgi:hypothetical protein
MKSSSSPFMLFFRNSGPEIFEHLSADQRENLVARWNGWYDDLASQGKAIEGQPLAETRRVVSGNQGARVTDGPFAETKEAIGGYVKLKVANREEATQIARTHPGLAYGLIIEVREMAGGCHLGIIGTETAKHEAAIE